MTPRSTLLAFDFDGTLAPIREDPGAVQMNRAAATLLAEVSQVPGVVVAVVSGRDADDLAARVRTPGVVIVASHGLEVRGPGGLLIRDTPPLRSDLPQHVAEAIAQAGLRVERKKHGIAVHWRGLPYEGCRAAVERFREWARTSDLDLVEGRCVVEARCPGADKEAALRWLVGALGTERVFYAGDDFTDFKALRFAAEHGRAVFVASDEREAPAGVTVVESFRELFSLVRQEVIF